ncbi:unnamed protein product [Lota lota]
MATRPGHIEDVPPEDVPPEDVLRDSFLLLLRTADPKPAQTSPNQSKPVQTSPHASEKREACMSRGAMGHHRYGNESVWRNLRVKGPVYHRLGSRPSTSKDTLGDVTEQAAYGDCDTDAVLRYA